MGIEQVHGSECVAMGLPDKCEDCGRPAKWLWLGSNFEPIRVVCGYHRRQYLTVIRLQEAPR